MSYSFKWNSSLIISILRIITQLITFYWYQIANANKTKVNISIKPRLDKEVIDPT